MHSFCCMAGHNNKPVNSVRVRQSHFPPTACGQMLQLHDYVMIIHPLQSSISWIGHATGRETNFSMVHLCRAGPSDMVKNLHAHFSASSSLCACFSYLTSWTGQRNIKEQSKGCNIQQQYHSECQMLGFISRPFFRYTFTCSAVETASQTLKQQGHVQYTQITSIIAQSLGPAKRGMKMQCFWLKTNNKQMNIHMDAIKYKVTHIVTRGGPEPPAGRSPQTWQLF